MVKVGETEMIVLNTNGLVSYILLKQKKYIFRASLFIPRGHWARQLRQYHTGPLMIPAAPVELTARGLPVDRQ